MYTSFQNDKLPKDKCDCYLIPHFASVILADYSCFIFKFDYIILITCSQITTQTLLLILYMQILTEETHIFKKKRMSNSADSTLQRW